MPYHVKYRPKDFDEVVGNTFVVKSIKGLFERGNVPNVWLLSGNSGVGKTTIARIIANKVGASPAGIFEMNVADFRGIDAMRDLVGKMNYKVPGSNVVVAILDECHQLTTEAQNLLLKSLEDTPKFAYFILATTEVGKILDTIRTRCMEFTLELVSDRDIKPLLIEVAKKEELSSTTIEGIDLVIKHAGGSPRLALNMLERISRTDSGLSDIEAMLEQTKMSFQQEGEIAISQKIVSSLLTKNKKAEWQKISDELRKYLFTRKGDPEFLRKGICSKLSFKVLEGDAEAASLLRMLLEAKFTKAGLISDLYSCCFSVENTKSRSGSNSNPAVESRKIKKGGIQW